MRRIFTLASLVALFGVLAMGTAVAQAAPGNACPPSSPNAGGSPPCGQPGNGNGKPGKSDQAERTCEKAGGLFVDVSPLVYACVFPNESTPQSRNKAERICEGRGGLFVDVSPLVYACVLPGGTLDPSDLGGTGPIVALPPLL